MANQVILVWQAGPHTPVTGCQVVRCLPAGISHARNRGVDAAVADIVAFVDDDERVELTWAQAEVSAFEEGADAATGTDPARRLRVRPLPHRRRRVPMAPRGRHRAVGDR